MADDVVVVGDAMGSLMAVTVVVVIVDARRNRVNDFMIGCFC